MGNPFFHDHEASYQVSVEIAKRIQMCGLNTIKEHIWVSGKSGPGCQKPNVSHKFSS